MILLPREHSKKKDEPDVLNIFKFSILVYRDLYMSGFFGREVYHYITDTQKEAALQVSATNEKNLEGWWK